MSDSKTERSAASLDVNIGSRQDPEAYQGLAHFLEHMLFLGTEKYPEAGEYQAFISAHGGSHNAYTSFEHTNYFFNVDPDSFEPALDRFAQFFVAPLFTEEYVEREKNAVHSEYTAKIKDERRKGADIFKAVINPQHPFAKLSVGTLETLSTDGDKAANGSLRDQLLAFYDQHYSASIMTLVLVGRESLDELEAMANSKFSAVSNNQKQVDTIEPPLLTPDSLPMTVTIKPEQSLRMLSIAFPTPQDIQYYQQKPMSFLGNILGHEGKGSLLSYLKAQGWAEGLGAGLGLSYNGGATFNITIQLTESGVAASDEVVASVFQAINRIKQSDNMGWLFTEQKAIAEQQFRYQQKAPAMSYAMSLSSDMHYYPARDLLRAGSLMTTYDPDLVARYLAYLTPQNSMVTLTAPSVETDKTTYFYQADYSVSKTDAEKISAWASAGINQQITLPEENLFIAEDLSIVKPKIAMDVPALISDKDGLRLWFKSADKFASPRGSLLFSVRSPVANDSAEHRVSLQLLAAILADELNEMSYSATLAGLNYSLNAHARGFSVKINGFSDKQVLLLQEILATLSSPAFNAERFEDIKLEHIRQLENRDKQQPYHLIMDELPDLLYKNSWSDKELLSVYQRVTLQQVKAYRELFLSAVQIDMLVYGNYAQQDAQRYAESVSNALLDKTAPPAAIEISQLAEQHYSHQIPSQYTDASIMLYIQAPDTDKVRRAAMGVTAQILRSDFYTSLRTEQQLGYIVTSGAYPLMDVPGLYFLVQSPVAGPEKLEQEINRFIQQRFATLADISEQDFDQQRNAVLSKLTEEPQNLGQQAQRYWQDISQNYYQFDFRDQLVAAMESLTYQQWQQFFVEDVIENRRRITVYTVGQFAEQSKVAGEPIGRSAEFKASLPAYTFQ
ncbi:insulinase family protein [Oceanicoccus sagamiensis]|uniref:insulinase family protein n=1 Tax=Oceanicoccus sagamiensis TaxID=716816 RepID=UPI0012F484D1|nr:insulinase family protein [Oceanicoccus sagamiensis]